MLQVQPPGGLISSREIMSSVKMVVWRGWGPGIISSIMNHSLKNVQVLETQKDFTITFGPFHFAKLNISLQFKRERWHLEVGFTRLLMLVHNHLRGSVGIKK